MNDQWGNKWYRVVMDGKPVIKFRTFRQLAHSVHLLIGSYSIEARKPNESWHPFPIEILKAYLSADPNAPKPADENEDKPIVEEVKNPAKFIDYVVFHEGKRLFEVKGRAIARLICTRLRVPYEVFILEEDGTLHPTDLEICSRDEFLSNIRKAWGEDRAIILSDIKKIKSKEAT